VANQPTRDMGLCLTDQRGLAQLTGFGPEFFQHTLEGVRRWK
jgi:hypothetical protein